MKSLHLLLLLVVLFENRGGLCKSDVHVGYRVTLAVPTEFNPGFIGRAYLMETDRVRQMAPNFRVALSVEAADGKYSCSLEVFLGDVKVWNSGHYSRFYVSDECVLELTEDGDLRLKGPKDEPGWRTGTGGQRVERLQILKNGNLVLVDVLNIIKWQSFNFPTDVMLWGQRLDVATQLTSFPTNSTQFYSFEIQHDKIALYLNSGKHKYSYWGFTPSKNRSINFVQLGSGGLELFNDHHKKIAQIRSQSPEPARFLALNNRTGNMGMFHFSMAEAKFVATFQAVNATCDLPLACTPYGICTFSNSCSCIGLVTEEHNASGLGSGPGCASGISQEFCEASPGLRPVEMVELRGVSNVLRDGIKKVNVSKDECTNLCLEDCTCVAALYNSGTNGTSYDSDCYLYGLMVGIKQVDRGKELAYMVKVPKGSRPVHSKSNPKKWVLVLVGVVDGLIILLVIGGLVYYLIWKKRKRSLGTNSNR